MEIQIEVGTITSLTSRFIEVGGVIVKQEAALSLKRTSGVVRDRRRLLMVRPVSKESADGCCAAEVRQLPNVLQRFTQLAG